MSDWAEDMVWVWVDEHIPEGLGVARRDSLSALLREVRRKAQTEWAPSVRADVLDEVRHVVREELMDSLANKVLARLDEL